MDEKTKQEIERRYINDKTAMDRGAASILSDVLSDKITTDPDLRIKILQAIKETISDVDKGKDESEKSILLPKISLKIDDKVTIPKGAKIVIGFNKGPGTIFDGDAFLPNDLIVVGTLKFGFDPVRPSDADINKVIYDTYNNPEEELFWKNTQRENLRRYVGYAIEAETELFKKAVYSLTTIVSAVMAGAGLKQENHYWQDPATYPENNNTWKHHEFSSASYNRTTEDRGVIRYEPETIKKIQESIDKEIAKAKEEKFKGSAKRKTGDLPPLG